MSKNIENNPAGVVIHLDEADSAKHASVLNNIGNLLIKGVYVVPAGIAQLVRRQREGWACVRP